MVGRAIVVFKFDGLDLPLKSLWYFGNSGSDITIGQMLIIVSLTVILGSFLFAAIGIFHLYVKMQLYHLYLVVLQWVYNI